jgi:hypothetical protein
MRVNGTFLMSVLSDSHIKFYIILFAKCKVLRPLEFKRIDGVMLIDCRKDVYTYNI